MYKSFYNLSEKPFQINTDPNYLWLGAKHKEALAILEYGITSENGFLLLTGDVGAGKTTLINALLKKLQDDVLVASVSNPNLDLMDFFDHIAQSLGIQQQFDRKGDFLIYFKEFLQKINQDHKRVLLIIDEAHNLSEELLEEIRLLSNIELPEKKLINIFFVGQNEINQTLKSNECRALRQRITLNYNIKPLSETETPQYIKHRLKVAGTEANIFKLKAIHEIYRFSGGYPRLINIICDRALLTGYVRSLKKITPDIILECVQELLLPDETKEDIYFNSSQPSIADNLVPDVELLSAKEKEIAFQETNSRDIPSMEPQTLDGATTFKNQTEYKHAFEFVLKLKNKGLKYVTPVGSFAKASVLALKDQGLEYAATVSYFVKRTWKNSLEFKNRRMLYGTLAGSLIIITSIVVLSYDYSISQSDQRQPVSQGFNTSVSMESNEPLSSSMIPFEKAVVKSPNETDNANGVIEPQFASRSEQDNFVPSELGAFATMEAGEDEAESDKLFLLEQAREAVESNNFSLAVELIESDMAQEIEIKELYVKALRGQAGLLFKDDTTQAENLLLKAVNLDTQNAMAYYDLGKLYTQTKDNSKAIEANLMAVALDPDSADTFFNLGFNYAAVKNYVRAEKMFLRTTELKPPFLDKAVFNLAIVQYKQGKKQQCIENLEKALKVNPDNQRAQKYLKRFKGL